MTGIELLEGILGMTPEQRRSPVITESCDALAVSVRWLENHGGQIYIGRGSEPLDQTTHKPYEDGIRA